MKKTLKGQYECPVVTLYAFSNEGFLCESYGLEEDHWEASSSSASSSSSPIFND